MPPEERRRYEARRLVYEERQREREARNEALRVAREQRQRDKDAAAVEAALRRG